MRLTAGAVPLSRGLDGEKECGFVFAGAVFLELHYRFRKRKLFLPGGGHFFFARRLA